MTTDIPDPSAPAAVIDLGTNTALLVVARRGAGGAMEVLEECLRTPRLGEGLARTGSLAPAALERALAALRELGARMDAHAVAPQRRRIVGTAALRRAGNAAELIERARRELGLVVEVLPEDEEAALGYEAATGGGLRPARAVIDVGGGSSELAWEGGRRRVSVPLGAVVLEELAPGSPAERERLLEAALRAVPAGLAAPQTGGPAGADGGVLLVGGTAANLASLVLGRARFELAGLEGCRVRAEQARAWAERLEALSPQRRLALPIEAERAPILPAGLQLLAALLERIGAAEARVTLRGLRHALVERLLKRPAGGTAGAPRQS